MVAFAPYSGQAAINRALANVGKRYPVGYCQKFTNEIFATGAVGDWDGDRSADAEDGWKKAQAQGRVVTASKIAKLSDIPAAVMLFWGGGSSDHGHAAVGVGGGQMVSTDLPSSGTIGKVAIGLAHDRWGLTFLGYATVDGNGHDLGSFSQSDGESASSAKIPKKGALFAVDANSGLYARKSPDGPNATSHGKKIVRPRGFTVRVVATKIAGGRVWAKGSGGLWYAAAYLRKK